MSNYISFFAYDELINQDVFREKGLEFKARFNVTLSSWKLVFNKTPLNDEGPEHLGLANIIPTANNLGMMEGILYEVDESLLPRLDEIYQHPNEYARQKFRFTKHDFTLVNGFAYVAKPDKVKKGLAPTKAMMKLFKAARKDFSMLYFARLMQTPTVD